MKMYKSTIRLVLSVVPLLLLAGMGSAVKGKKAPPVKTDATVVKQEKVPPVLPAPTESATGEEINWQVISSGGTDGSSTNFALKGTVGQTAVGYGSSINYGLNQGFWQEFGGGCCQNRGNVDGIVGIGGPIDVADLTYLVSYLFKSGPAPPCEEEGNADGIVGIGGPIDVADLTYLVAYLFKSGPAPPPC